MVKQVDYVYCNDLLSVEYATHTLADSPVLIIDCEGRNIGALGGALSLICIGTERAEQIFVFDVPALKPFKLHLQPLFRTLANSAVKKVMWDCRNDFLEIQSEYNVTMTGIVDLQLAEIRARTTVKKEGDFRRKWRFTRGSRPVPLQSIDQNPELFFEVHRLQGMHACIRQLGLPTTRKDPEVVAMHRAAGSSIWMNRPLPPKLLTYAARDIEQIGALYEYFKKSAWITPTDEPLLVAQSMRYAYSRFCRGRVPDDDPFGQCVVLPLDVLSESPGPKVQCHGCHRMQSLTCYSMRKQGGWSETRTNICRACQIELLMKRTKYPITWITVERQM
ncbi:ribonuclease H-like domain-containing protein [Pisolithus croceorrhizus]|nr:ribonuclease H-like domain-containing protein [Pisolithus croceorrhizus]KAI6169795.1 ribonuclease H-like domain-containing protein [Pisolithus thermaeus]